MNVLKHGTRQLYRRNDKKDPAAGSRLVEGPRTLVVSRKNPNVGYWPQFAIGLFQKHVRFCSLVTSHRPSTRSQAYARCIQQVTRVTDA